MTKVEKCRKFGAKVILHGEHIGQAKEFAQKEYSHLRYINGYDDPEIIAGAGTMGIEILEQIKDVDVILVPVGGAGLIAGVALAVKTIKPSVQVIGVEPENVASFQAALRAGEPVNAFKEATLADGLAVPVVGPTAFNVARRFVDNTVTVSEKMIALAMLRLIEMDKLVVEGGGAAALASIIPGGPLFNHFPGKKVFGLSRLGIFWVQPRRESHEVNYPQTVFYYLPSVIIFCYCIWANFQYYKGVEQGLSKTIGNRLSIMERSKRYTAAYVVYGCVVFAIEFATFVRNGTNSSVSPVPAYFYSMRGIWALMIIFYSNFGEVTWKDLHPFRLSLPAEMLQDIAKERLLLQPHLNSALRAEILYFATQGIICAATESGEAERESTPPGAENETRLFAYEVCPDGLRASLTRPDSERKENDPSSETRSSLFSWNARPAGATGDVSAGDREALSRLQEIERLQNKRLSRKYLHALNSEVKNLGGGSGKRNDDRSEGTEETHNPLAAKTRSQNHTPYMQSRGNHAADQSSGSKARESLSEQDEEGIELRDSGHQSQSQRLESTDSAATIKWRDTMDVEYGLQNRGGEETKQAAMGSPPIGSSGWRRLHEGRLASDAGVGPNDDLRNLSQNSASSSGSQLSRALQTAVDRARAALSPAYREFRFKDYAPRIFAQLRQMQNIDALSYADAFETTCRERFSEGRSGAFLFFSKDQRYIVKTMSETESASLRRVLPQYLAHLKRYPNSLIVRFLGVHSLVMYGVELYFCVMLNVFPLIPLSERYDLKGSWVNRHGQNGKVRQQRVAMLRDNARRQMRTRKKAHLDRLRSLSESDNAPIQLPGDEEEEEEVEKEAPLYQDNDLQHPIVLEADTSALLAETIRRDIVFLRDLNFMDYSLLIGVRRERFRVLSREGQDAADHGGAASVSSTAPSSSERPSDVVAITRASSTAVAPGGRTGPIDISVAPIVHADHRGSHAASEKDAWRQQSVCGGVDGDFSAGLKAVVVEGPGTYYVGVIDILQQWDWNKRIERFLKTYVKFADPDGLSAIEPHRYASRFWQRAVLDTFEGLEHCAEDPDTPVPSAASASMGSSTFVSPRGDDSLTVEQGSLGHNRSVLPS
eukprot:gene5506-3924_t